MISSHSALHRTASSANTSGKQGFCVGTASAAEDRSCCRSSKRPTDLRGYDRRGNSYCTRRKPTSTPAWRRRFCGPPTPACRESHGLPQAGTRASCRRTSGIRINPQCGCCGPVGFNPDLQDSSRVLRLLSPGIPGQKTLLDLVGRGC